MLNFRPICVQDSPLTVSQSHQYSVLLIMEVRKLRLEMFAKWVSALSAKCGPVNQFHSTVTEALSFMQGMVKFIFRHFKFGKLVLTFYLDALVAAYQVVYVSTN